LLVRVVAIAAGVFLLEVLSTKHELDLMPVSKQREVGASGIWSPDCLTNDSLFAGREREGERRRIMN
jgi:hypothetical protein